MGYNLRGYFLKSRGRFCCNYFCSFLLYIVMSTIIFNMSNKALLKNVKQKLCPPNIQLKIPQHWLLCPNFFWFTSTNKKVFASLMSTHESLLCLKRFSSTILTFYPPVWSYCMIKSAFLYILFVATNNTHFYK